MPRRQFSADHERWKGLTTAQNTSAKHNTLKWGRYGTLLVSAGVSQATCFQILPKQLSFRENARLRKVKITFRDASVLNISHHVLFGLTHGKITTIWSKKDYAWSPRLQKGCSKNRLCRELHAFLSNWPSWHPGYLKLCIRAYMVPTEQKNKITSARADIQWSEVTKLWCTLGVTFAGLISEKKYISPRSVIAGC